MSILAVYRYVVTPAQCLRSAVNKELRVQRQRGSSRVFFRHCREACQSLCGVNVNVGVCLIDIIYVLSSGTSVVSHAG